MHGKNFICDDLFAVCGTINFDYRSLAHHFENAVWMDKTKAVEEMKKDFLETQEVSMAYSPSLNKLNPFEKILKFGIHLFAPML